MPEWLNPMEDQRVIAARLRTEVPAARVEPPPGLAWRALGALGPRAAVAPRARRRASPSYLTAAAVLLLVGALAIVFSTAETHPPAPRTASAPHDMEIVIGIDTTRYESFVQTRAGHLATAFESPLFDQARRMFADARHAVGTVLARVPAPVRIETGRKEMRSPGGLRIRESG